MDGRTLDGRIEGGVVYPDMETVYPRLYAYLGTNVLPDYREFALVGAEQNTTDVYNASTNPNGTIHTHDTYTQGKSKDDCMQKITGSVDFANPDTWCNLGVQAVTDGAFYKIQQSDKRKNMGPTNNSHTAYKLGFDSSRQTRTSTVTRGKRKAVYWYIKY